MPNGPPNPWSESNSPSLRQNQGGSHRHGLLAVTALVETMSHPACLLSGLCGADVGGCAGWIRTTDIRVMSPADCRTVLPRIVFGLYPRRDLNSRQAACKAGALPLSYGGRYCETLVGVPGFEPGAFRSQSGRATKLRYTPLARMTGVEPATGGFGDRCSTS